MRFFLLLVVLIKINGNEYFSKACISYTSDFYRNKCTPLVRGVIRHGCEGNGLAVLESTPALTKEITHNKKKYTIGVDLYYGMYPNLHLAHPYESLVPAIQFCRDNSDFIKQIVFPEDFAESTHGRVTIEGIRIHIPTVSILIIKAGIKECYDDFILIKRKTQLLLSGSAEFGPLLREIWRLGCKISDERLIIRGRDVMFFRRNPENIGNIRYLLNEQDLVENLKRNYKIRSSSYKIKNGDFCHQIRGAYIQVPIVVVMHGAHIMPLLMLAENTTIIEILPRNLHTSFFCGLYNSIGAKGIILANSKKTQLYEAQEKWCKEDKFFYDRDAEMKSVSFERNQDLLHSLVFLNEKEIEYISILIKNNLRANYSKHKFRAVNT